MRHSALIINLLSYWAVQTAAQSSPSVSTHLLPPEQDPFYCEPANLSSFAPGHVLRNRTVSTTLLGNAVQSHQLYYRTTDAQDEASGTVTTLWIPAKPVHPPKLVSYQLAEDSVNLNCAPSWSYASSTSPAERDTDTQTSFLLQWALKEGYYVVSADLEGPNSALLVGLVEGRAVLDSIRAAIDFLRLPKGNGTDIGLTGYSGGGHSSVWASSLAPTYAPELNIVGAAFGGTPLDLHSLYDGANGTPSSIISGAIMVGLANGHPEFNETLNALLTPAGKELARTIRSTDFCTNSQRTYYSSVNITSFFTSNPFANPVVSRIFGEESLLPGRNATPIPVPTFPRFQWHGVSDKGIPIDTVAAYVAQQCAEGADIRFVRLPGLDHDPAYFTGIPGAYRFLKQAFEGTLGMVACGSNVTVPKLGSDASNDLLGFAANDLLRYYAGSYAV